MAGPHWSGRWVPPWEGRAPLKPVGAEVGHAVAWVLNGPFALLLDRFDDTDADRIRREVSRGVRRGVRDAEGMRALRKVAHERPREVKRAARLSRRFYGEILIGEIAARRLEAAVAGTMPQPTTAEEWTVCVQEGELMDRWDSGAFAWLAGEISELGSIGDAELDGIRAAAAGPRQAATERRLMDVLFRVEVKLDGDRDEHLRLQDSVVRYLRPIVGPDASTSDPPIRRSRVALLVAARELLVRLGCSPDRDDGTFGTD